MRRPLKVLAVVLANIVLVVVLLEVGLRLLKPRHHGLQAMLYKTTLQTDYSRADSLQDLMEKSIIGYRPHEQVGGFVLNSRGFRTREYDEIKGSNVSRVLALGDSFTYGGVPTAEYWTNVLETGLADCRAENVEVLRLGVPATGPPFQLRLWQIEGARLDADLVVLGFFVGNDFFDEQGRLPGWRGWLDQLSTVSYTMLAARNLSRLPGFNPSPDTNLSTGPTSAQQSAGGFELPGAEERYRNRGPRFTRRRYLRIEADRMSLCLKNNQWKLGFRFDRVKRFLHQMHTEVKATGARFVILIMPDEYQVNDPLMLAVAKFAGRSKEDYDITAPQRRLTAFCSDRGIDCLDLLPAFRREAQDRRLYLQRDTHWNRAGNRLAARELTAFLCESERSPGQLNELDET